MQLTPVSWFEGFHSAQTGSRELTIEEYLVLLGQ